MATIKLDFHNHPLTLVQPAPQEEEEEDASSGNSEKCSICEKGLIKTSSFFQCMETECNNFRIHANCMPVLPRRVGYKQDEHPLILAQSPVYERWNDYKDGEEYICDHCEQKRSLDDICYYSQTSRRAVHVHCVLQLDQVLTMLEKESSLGHSLGERNLGKSKDVLASNEKVVELATKKLDELEAVMAVLRTKVKAGTSRLESLKATLKALEDKRDATSSTRVKGRS